ncbi:NmrA family NAD(P)-binding protein [Nocardia sp. GCM10030253]|uniref:NmrA family NAD(P)-binding protein n=1 Tax=Nocardia sp. GCM10030253 TaxID=3273404 RepID=UPI00362E9137
MSPQQNPILVTGATGKQGGATALRLLADGVPVRALVRDPEAPAARTLAHAGAELVVADFDTPTTLDAATAGARAVFLVPPAAYGPNGWDVDLEAARGIAVVDAAKRADVEQIVFTGVASMSDDSSWGIGGKRNIEAAVAASGLRYTLLRPVRFMENYLMRNTPVDGINDGVNKHLFPADRPLQVVALADIAAFAALAFADRDRFHGHTIELASDAILPSKAVELISEATGHQVSYRELSESEAGAIGEQIGNTWRLVRETGGWRADIAELRRIYPRLATFESWLAATGAAQIKALLDSEQVSSTH